VAPFGEKGETSAIAKLPTLVPMAVGLSGLAHDEQADLAHHGGPDKAIHHYPMDHYAGWRDAIGNHSLLMHPGAFGENISTSGMVETGVCIGDRYRLGTALVEISQGRQPCWKLGHRFGNAKVPGHIVATRKSGWYYRVIEPGLIRAGDSIALVERPWPKWTVSDVFGLLIGGGTEKPHTRISELATLTPLASSWKERANRLAAK
jgi:MOSC domain-containing protein YiiM